MVRSSASSPNPDITSSVWPSVDKGLSVSFLISSLFHMGFSPLLLSLLGLFSHHELASLFHSSVCLCFLELHSGYSVLFQLIQVFLCTFFEFFEHFQLGIIVLLNSASCIPSRLFSLAGHYCGIVD